MPNKQLSKREELQKAKEISFKSKLRKLTIKVLVINILSIVVVLFSFEAYLYHIACERERLYSGESYVPSRYSFIMKSFDNVYEYVKIHKMRKPEGLKYSKKPIILFGCSFAYGDSLNNNQTLSYKLSHLTKRPVYNRASGGWGVQHMLYQSRRRDFYKEVKDPEYIIYVFIGEQVFRLEKRIFWQPSNDLYLRYKEKNADLIEVKSPWSAFWFLYIMKNYFENVEEKNYRDSVNIDKKFDFMKLHFIKSKIELQKHYPKAKFVILKYREIYPGEGMCTQLYMDINRWQELEKEGFIVIDTKDFVGNSLCSYNYTLSKQDTHPNEKAWDLIVPALAKRLNL